MHSLSYLEAYVEIWSIVKLVIIEERLGMEFIHVFFYPNGKKVLLF